MPTIPIWSSDYNRVIEELKTKFEKKICDKKNN